MNNRYDADQSDDEETPYVVVGYDDYGRPVYGRPQQQVPQQQPYDPYAAQQQGQTYDYYGQQPAYPQQQYGQQQPYDQQGYGYDAYGTQPSYDAYGQQTATDTNTAYIPPQQSTPVEEEAPPAPAEDAPAQEQPDYKTEQFAFVEEPTADSEDVIDWLNFTENRTERREEAKRRAKGRLVALVVVLALTAVGGVGYLAYAGKLPGLSSSDSKATATTGGAAQKRDVVVVHLHDTAKGGTSTLLLVDNTTAKRGTTVLLPNSLVVTTDDGNSTTLAKSVDDDGSAGTRDALDTVLGTNIEGTWRLDTPYLQNLVDLVGGIEVDTDATVPDPASKKGEALVNKGEKQSLSGKMAVAYATYRGEEEKQDAQLARFGQVVQGVLRKVSSDAQAATITVQTLAQILDPSLTDKDLGAFLANLASLAKGGDYKTDTLPVQKDGTLSAEASTEVVKNVLGGTAKSPDPGAAVRVSVQNATGKKADSEDARVVLLNGGFTVLDGGTVTSTASASSVTYSDDAEKNNATEVAKTLGLAAGAVKKSAAASGGDVTVILGKDYKPSAS
ncbi:LCP family protein [Streptomyces acidiscabies]|uniref:LCP family protein n=1 Tax=Streptomyces acidiscabies TaxID=42234 RepID=A0AAP6BEH2_9ACTN|nr:LCP family protein [Streptomyces acidiscabies]MBP5939669.1 LytR family transcriptional regulator [Streptomyces sp. LBUM 1476]MBZ3910841.1 LCP family protein [Streptomyces acidiscabies]MDX2962977.1 LCP family protein [Streptomyces acidiscabies]MDX3017477.1 LCP family protein [Streptomyces acidiscabies]MDX3787953.1 LCP family protein [Streptomyces acidiscabies]